MSTTKNSLSQPTAFVGHGSPMNALAQSDYTESLNQFGRSLISPRAVLCISAHWQTNGSFLTSTDSPKLIYDFNGFPDELYQVKYPVLGSHDLALKIQSLIKNTKIEFDHGSWGLDHGSWSILKHIFPKADVPVLQLSLDINKSPEEHFKFAQELALLRDHQILILCSGNIVHNLREISWNENETPAAWALDYDLWSKQNLVEKNWQNLVENFLKVPHAKKSVPTLEHYLPLIYTIGSARQEDRLEFIYEKIQHASISMRSFILK